MSKPGYRCSSRSTTSIRAAPRGQTAPTGMPPARGKKPDKTQHQKLNLWAVVGWRWLSVPPFAQPPRYSRLNVVSPGGDLPYYQIARQAPLYAVFPGQGRSPAGQMEITTS